MKRGVRGSDRYTNSQGIAGESPGNRWPGNCCGITREYRRVIAEESPGIAGNRKRESAEDFNRIIGESLEHQESLGIR